MALVAGGFIFYAALMDISLDRFDEQAVLGGRCPCWFAAPSSVFMLMGGSDGGRAEGFFSFFFDFGSLILVPFVVFGWGAVVRLCDLCVQGSHRRLFTIRMGLVRVSQMGEMCGWRCVRGFHRRSIMIRMVSGRESLSGEIWGWSGVRSAVVFSASFLLPFEHVMFLVDSRSMFWLLCSCFFLTILAWIIAMYWLIFCLLLL
ncbi:hypothetical protein Dimus_035747 [Dionaea muscipula]